MELFNKLNINKLDRNELRILYQAINTYVRQFDEIEIGKKLTWELDNLDLFLNKISERIQDINSELGEWIRDNRN
jgi:cobalamin biosynthesis Co2+ chelatase CbiK